MHQYYGCLSAFHSLQLTNTGTAIEAKLKATLALAPMATRKVHTLSMSAAWTQALSTLIYVCSEKKSGAVFIGSQCSVNQEFPFQQHVACSTCIRV